MRLLDVGGGSSMKSAKEFFIDTTYKMQSLEQGSKVSDPKVLSRSHAGDLQRQAKYKQKSCGFATTTGGCCCWEHLSYAISESDRNRLYDGGGELCAERVLSGRSLVAMARVVCQQIPLAAGDLTIRSAQGGQRHKVSRLCFVVRPTKHGQQRHPRSRW